MESSERRKASEDVLILRFMGVEDAIKKLREAVVLETDENKKHIMITALEGWAKTDKQIRMALGFWDDTSG